MQCCAILLPLLLFLWNYILPTDANAMLKPTHRGMMWTRGTYNSAGYNYMGINCGGISKIKQHNGKCGVCGDSYSGPRNHETGGKYATGAIARVMDRGERNINVQILLNSDQGGYFEFRLCASNGMSETQDCFDKHLLKITEGRVQGNEFAYIIYRAGIIPLTIEIPERLYCEKCVLQWKYITGNTFGRDELGRGCLGCGQQETFINCADITIKGWEIITTPKPPTTPIPTTIAWTTTTTPPPPPAPTAPPAPPTTTPPPPTPPSSPAPSTTVFRPKQITKARPTKNTKPARFVTRQRRPVTDVDEGSRRRNGIKAYSNAYSPVPAPAQQTPAVLPPSALKSQTANGLPEPMAVIQPAPVKVQRQQPDKTLKINDVIHVQKSQQAASRKPLANLGRTRNRPFKIPPPPRLSNEQIAALNSNNNDIPYHDPLQKYVQVGSSKMIITAVDFTAARRQQVETPPTLVKVAKTKSTAATINVSTSVPSKLTTGKHKQSHSVNVFSSFGRNEVTDGPSNAPAAQQQNQNTFGGNLMNEYGMMNDVGASFNQQQQGQTSKAAKRQNRYPQSNSGNIFNDFVIGPADVVVVNDHRGPIAKQHVQYGFTNSPKPPTRNPSGNPHFSMDRYNSMRPTPQSNQMSQQHTGSAPSNKHLKLLKEDMFGTTRSGTSLTQAHSISAGSQNSTRFSLVSGHQSYNPSSRYGQIPTLNPHVSSLANTYQAQVFTKGQNQYPDVSGSQSSQTSRYTNNPPISNNQSPGVHDNIRKTTKLPVIDTATTRIKGTQSESIAAWRKTAITPTHNTNMPDLTDVPINLFKNQERSAFKAPAVFERFTNYQVGGSRTKNKSIPESLQQAINIRKQGIEQLKSDAQTLKNSHLNAGIHSPETYFGQDHYISHDVELSVPAFGGSNTHDVNAPSNIYADKQAQSADKTPFTYPTTSTTVRNTTKSASQKFKNEHLNAGIHSPENYFGQDHYIRHGVDMNVPASGGSNAHDANALSNIYADKQANGADKTPFTYSTTSTTVRKSTTPTKQPSTATPVTTKAVAQTTINTMDHQMQELKKLRERLDQLQKLMNLRKLGFPSQTTPLISPTQSFQQSQQTSATSQDMHASSQLSGNHITPGVPNEKKTNVLQNNFYNKKSHVQNDNYIQKTDVQNSHDIQNTANSNAIWGTTLSVKTVIESTTVPPMKMNTTKYIQYFKAQMLQSIQEANARKKQHSSVTSSPASVHFIHNKRSTSHPVKPYGNEEKTYNAPIQLQGVQRSQDNELASKTSQQKQGPIPVKQQQQEQQQIQINKEQDMQERQKKIKYRMLLQLLQQRRKHQVAMQNKSQQKQQQQQQQHQQQDQHNQKQQQQRQHHQQHQQQQQQQQHQQKQQRQQNTPQKQTQSHPQPPLAEVQMLQVNKQQINQNRQQTIQMPYTERPVHNLNQPNNDAVSPHTYKPTARKTTIDKLAARLAINMAEKIKQGDLNKVPNFRVLPLSSESVMAALRNIARSVLKETQFQSQMPELVAANNHSSIQSSRKNNSGSKMQALEKPSMREMHISNAVRKEKLTDVKDMSTTTSSNAQTSTVNNKVPLSPQVSTTVAKIDPTQASKKQLDALKHRQELIRRMKMMMRKRRPTHVSNTQTRNNDRPSHLPDVRPSHLGQSEFVGSQKQRPNNNRPVHIINHPNNGRPTLYDDTTITTQHNVLTTTRGELSQTSPSGPQNKHRSTSDATANQVVTQAKLEATSNSNQTVYNHNKVRLSPDIARSMLLRVRKMLAKKKNNNGQINRATTSMSTKDVLVMPLNREMLYKLLKSMARKKQNRKTGR